MPLVRVSAQRLSDVLLIAIICLAPLIMGGRHPLGRLVYVTLVALFTLASFSEFLRNRHWKYRVCGLEPMLVTSTLVILLQCVPLPKELLRHLSPWQSEYLLLWNRDRWMGADWATLSFAPTATRIGLSVWLAHVALLLSLYQRLRDRKAVERLVRTVASAGILMACIGLLQYLLSNGKFLWVLENPYRDTRDVLRATFYNQNHAAHFLTLTLAPLAWWIGCRWQTNQKREPTFRLAGDPDAHEFWHYLLAGSLPLVVFSILLTGSRGGMLMALAVGAVALVPSVQRDGWRSRSCYGLAGMIGIVSLALIIHGLDSVRDEVTSLASVSLDELDQHGGRRKIWWAAWQTMVHFIWLGSGVGTFGDVLPLYYHQPRQHSYAYAESGYLQIGAETGWVGLGLLVAGLGMIVKRLLPLLRNRSERADAPLAWCCLAGLLGSAVHSVFDFVWFLPGCLALTIALLAAAMRLGEFGPDGLPREPENAGTPYHRTLPMLVLMPLALLAIASVRINWGPARAEPYWNAYLVASTRFERQRSGPAESPAVAQLEQWRALLLQAVRHHPVHADARMRLASIELQLFEIRQAESDNPMSLIQIRDAALASQFASVAEQDRWLERVMQERRDLLDSAWRHVRTGLSVAPLQGMGYVYGAELAFLMDPGTVMHEALMEQALRVRPYASSIQFAAGRQAMLAGRLERALDHWRRAYHHDSAYQEAITQQLAAVLPAETFMEQFQPDLMDLYRLTEHYRQRGLEREAVYAGNAFVDRVVERWAIERQSYVFQLAYELAARMADKRALMLARRAVELDPLQDTMRRRLGLELMAQENWTEAILHLQQCLDRNPADIELSRKLELARRQQRLH